jgi:hypothetical protein
MTALPPYEAFAGCLNQKFCVHLDGGEPLETELVDVSEHLLSERQERFSLVFRGANDRFLGQGTRTIEHAQLGRFDLFLVPIGQDEAGTYYESCFNRLRKKA